MTESERGFAVRRIVIALESGCENLRALDQAAELAERMKAELHAVFVEDLRLLRVAALPFTRQVSLCPAGTHPLEPGDVESELRALAAGLRRHLEDVATRLKLAWSFETVRGDPLSVISATDSRDVLVVETSTRPFARHLRLSTEWSEIAITCERPCLLLGTETGGRKGVLAVHDGSEAGERALSAAMAMDGGGAGLSIAATEQTLGRADLVHRFPDVPLRSVGGVDPAALRDLLRQSNCAVAILPASLIVSHRAQWRDLLATAPCAILLVR